MPKGRQILAVNIKSTIFSIQFALPLMPAGVSIVVIGSNASKEPSPGMSVYGVAKAVVRNLVRGWVQEIKDTGIRTNILSPCPLRTPDLNGFFLPEQAGAIYASLAELSTVGRIGETTGIAADSGSTNCG